MTTLKEFIEQQIIPALGEYVDDYDVDGIARHVCMWDDKLGYVMRPDVNFWKVVEEHDNEEAFACPACGEHVSVLSAKLDSVGRKEMGFRLHCCECGTVFHALYSFDRIHW